MKTGHYFTVSWVDDGELPLYRFVLHLLGLPQPSIAAVVRGVAEVAARVRVPSAHGRTSLTGAPPEGARIHHIQDYLWADKTLCRDRLERHLTEFVNGRPLRRFPLTPGGGIDGWEIVGRERELREAEQLLREASLHLMAPRRYGKTSLLRRLRELLPKTIHLDLADIKSLPGLCVHLAAAAIEQGLLETPNELPELNGWPPPGSPVLAVQRARDELVPQVERDCPGFFGGLLKALADRDVVVLLDEFSLLLRDAADRDERTLRRCLERARALRTRPTKPLRWVVAGSAGLRLFIEFKGLADVFDDLQALQLGPLAEADARMFVEELFFGRDLAPTPEVVTAVLHEVGLPIPYFVQILAHHAVSQARKGLSTEVIRAAYQRGVLGTDGSQWFRSFQLSERGYPEHLRAAGAAILKRLSRSEEPVPDQELQDLFGRTGAPAADYALLLSCLSEDYDLESRSGALHMRSKVLRDCWSLGEPWLTGAQ